MIPKTNTPVGCPAELTVHVIGGRWKAPIVYHLLSGTRRFTELKRALGPVTPKMLTQQLRELEADGIVHREVYPQVPPRVEYSLTPRGRSLEPVIKAMCTWARPAEPPRSAEPGVRAKKKP
jgi:DNA-binding HxlR family transcriptional regulator